jgi:hypothetical protein
MKKTRILQLFLGVMGLFLLFWWPLSHWFYADWYHDLLGFAGYDPGMVRIIGTSGIVPVLLLFVTATDPVRYRGNLAILVLFSFLLAGTYLYLILSGQFPLREVANVVLCMVSAGVLMILWPREEIGLSTLQYTN